MINKLHIGPEYIFTFFCLSLFISSSISMSSVFGNILFYMVDFYVEMDFNVFQRLEIPENAGKRGWRGSFL